MTCELTTAPICCATEGGREREFGCEFEPQKRGGIQGIVDAYHQILLQIRLYRPTNFSPIINHMARFAAHLLQQGTAAAPQEALSWVVLAEVPKQLVSYNEWQECSPPETARNQDDVDSG